MHKRLQAGVFLVVASLAGIAGFYLNRAGLTISTADSAASRLMLVSLSDLSGNPQTLSEVRQKVLVLNFWATWCLPCREEIPALIRLQRKYASNGVQFVGIAIDNASKVREYAEEMRINYTLLIGGIQTLGLTKDLGNNAGVLPFTLVLNRAGHVVYAHAGAVTETTLGAVLGTSLLSY